MAVEDLFFYDFVNRVKVEVNVEDESLNVTTSTPGDPEYIYFKNTETGEDVGVMVDNGAIVVQG